jgi:PPK2 family polyphosphate:nucleotide phosphotransferase
MAKQKLRPDAYDEIHLSDYDPAYDNGLDKADVAEETEALKQRLIDLQEILYAQGKYGMLIVLQAMDAGGKDGTIKHVFSGLNPQGVKITSFKVPTELELSHDFLWRIHQHAPEHGQIAIFNRSHYEDVLVVRVKELVPEKVWRARYDHINAFEKLLADSGIVILKFFLHISKDEQKERFQERLDDPTKHWKFSVGDLAVREQWDDYMRAYEDALTHCNTEYAPWHIVPANRKWYRNYVVTRAIVEALEALPLAYPPEEPGLENIVIPD